MFKQLNENCIALIAEMAGLKDQWKHRFSTDVLPKLDQGWMMVALYNNKPCLNCYMYANSKSGGINGVCLNCQDEPDRILTCFDEIRKISVIDYFDRYEDYARYRDFYTTTLFSLKKSMIESSLVFQKIQMLNLV